MYKKWVLIALIIYTFIINSIFCCSSVPHIVYNNQNDSLQQIIDSLYLHKDTMFIIKDSISKEIIKITENYETKYISVDSQSINSDIKFFSEYLSKNY